MAVFNLMHAKQGTRNWTEFSRDVDRLARQCQFDTKPYTRERAIKDALIFGTSDEKLRKEALAKDLGYEELMRSATSYEQARKSSVSCHSPSDSPRIVDENIDRTLTSKIF